MSVRAKFFVQSIERTTSSTTVKLSAVCRGNDNKEWSAYTPAGQISMVIKNELASSQFEPGEEFFVDFSPAPKTKEGME